MVADDDTDATKDCCSGAGKEDMGLPGKGQSGARSCLRAERLPQNMEFRVQGHVAVHWCTSLTQNWGS